MATQLSLAPPLQQPSRLLDELPPLLSFFSGAGFLDLGLIRAGFQITSSLEVDPRFCEAHNFGMESYFRALGKLADAPRIRKPESILEKGPSATRVADRTVQV